MNARFPAARPRRLRRTPALRRMVAETRLHPSELILPMFVKEGIDAPQPVASMPGVYQHTRDSLRRAAHEAAEAGVGGVMLFGIPAERDATGTQADAEDGILQRGIRIAVEAAREHAGGGPVVMADTCLDEFTDHGHCGVLRPDGSVDNDATLERYADMALAQAETGAHLLGLSGRMDGQPAAVRAALDDAARTVPFGRTTTLVGLAGSVTSVTAHALGLTEYRRDAVHGAVLGVDRVLAACDDLLHRSREQRLALGFMHPGRADVIGAGALVWAEIVRRVRDDVAAEQGGAGGELAEIVTSESDILDGIALSA